MSSKDNDYCREFLPASGIDTEHHTLSVVTVFAVGQSGRDCAAYRAITTAGDLSNEQIAEIRGRGNKISEYEARECFDFGHLVWRK